MAENSAFQAAVEALLKAHDAALAEARAAGGAAVLGEAGKELQAPAVAAVAASRPAAPPLPPPDDAAQMACASWRATEGSAKADDEKYSSGCGTRDEEDWDASGLDWAAVQDPHEETCHWLRGWVRLVEGIMSEEVSSKAEHRIFDMLPQWTFPRCTAGELEQGPNTPAFARALSKHCQDLHRVTSSGSTLNMPLPTLGAVPQRNVLELFVMSPKNPLRVFWTVFGNLLLIWDTIFIPMLVFDFGTFGDVLEAVGLFVSAYWVLDMGMQCFFAVHTADGGLVYSPASIWQIYFRTKFKKDAAICSCDLLVLILVYASTIQLGSEGVGINKVVRLLRLARLVRLMRAGRLYELLRAMEDHVSTDYILLFANLSRYTLYLFFLNHYVACMWYGVTLLDSGEDSWVEHFNVGEDLASRYVVALHWAATQFSPATQNVFPTTLAERIFASITALAAMLVMSSLLGNVANAVNQLRFARMDTAMQEARLRHFLVSAQAPAELSARIVKFHRRAWRKQQSEVLESDLPTLKQMPESLKIQLHVVLYSSCFVGEPLFELLTEKCPSFMRQLCHTAMSQRCCVAGQDLFIDGAVCPSLLLASSGAGSYQPFFTVQSRMGLHRSKTGIEALPVPQQEWLCEMALWCNWHYAGHLVVSQGSVFVELAVAAAVEVGTQRVNQATRAALRIAAILTCAYAEEREAAGEPVSDLPLDRSFRLRRVERVLDFARVESGRVSTILGGASNGS